jgi:pyruvate formate lyase activating enzyme
MKGLIFSVKKYSVHDGPGIRVTFFMKGCPLNCHWCHNPEGLSPFRENIKQISKIGEREFVEDRTAGEYYGVEDILQIVKKEEIFIRQSGGGVTFSGGEPLMQSDFLLETLQACRSNGYHTAVDTSGYAEANDFLKILKHTDLFLFDIKHLDEQRHIALAGTSNRLILSNFSLLLNAGKEIIIRFPVIPGHNDQPEHLVQMKSFINQNRKDNLKKLCLLPFHKTGASKYHRLGLEYNMEGVEQPSAERMLELKNYFSETGIKVKIGG